MEGKFGATFLDRKLAILPLKVRVPPNIKINSKRIKDLNVRRETIKLLEENIGSKLFDICLSHVFLDMFPQARETESKNKQMGLDQTKKHLHSKGNYQQNGKAAY